MSEHESLWIWYPGDFEIWLHERISAQRETRGAIFPAFWRLDRHYSNVIFRKAVDLQQAEQIALTADGAFSVYVDGKNNDRVSSPSFTVPAGRHEIMVTVFNTRQPPALHVRGKTIRSDGSWEVSCYNGHWPAAASWRFSDPVAPPSQYRLAVRPEQPVRIDRTEFGFLADFGKETIGYVQLHGVQGVGDIHLFYGESLEEALDPISCETFDHIRTDGESNRDITLETSRAFRFVNVVAEPGAAVNNISMLYEFLPVSYRGEFRCSNERLNRIWDTSVYTLHLNTREFFYDGIKRDRWVWSGDALQSFLMNYYSFFDLDATKRTLIALRGKDPVETHINTILDYSFYWFIALFDYYLYTGDVDFIRGLYGRMLALMEFCLSRRNAAGFMEGQKEDWVFVDWADIDNRGEVSVEQLLLVRSLEAMARFAAIVGDTGNEERFAVLAGQVKRKVFEIFWDDKRGGFLHNRYEGKLGDKVTKYTNMFALLFNYLDERQKVSVRDRVLLNSDVQGITTPYMRFYELASLCEIGEHLYVLQEILHYWGGMLDQGATTFWEEFNPEITGTKQYEMYGAPYGKSLCHAWGASPIYLLGRYFLGVRPLAPGYDKYIIEPRLGGLEWIQGTVPTGKGNIHVFMDERRIEIQSDCGMGPGILRFRSFVQPLCSEGTIVKMGEGSYELEIAVNGITYSVDYGQGERRDEGTAG